MPSIDQEKFSAFVEAQFGGVIVAGSHRPDGEACILECYSQYIGVAWTDSPQVLRIWDIRPLNDLQVEESLRTRWMVPLVCAYDGCHNWPLSRQEATLTRIVLLTTQRMIAELPGLPDDVRERCRAVDSLEAAARAAQLVIRTARPAELAECVLRAARLTTLTARSLQMLRDDDQALRNTRVARASWAAWNILSAAISAYRARSNETEMARLFVQISTIWLEAAQEDPSIH